MALEQRSLELLGRRLALISVGFSAVLSVAKIIVGLQVGSTAVTSDGLEAAVDVVSSGIVYGGLVLASKPADEDHPYGHGRYETLAGLGVGAILFFTGSAIFWRSVFLVGHPASMHSYVLYPLVAAVVIKLGLAGWKWHVARRIASSALEADALHDLTDLLSTVIALTAVVLLLWDPVRFAAADRLGGSVIGIIIVFLAMRVVRHTVDQLVDTMPEAGMMDELRRVARDVPGAVGIEKCFARRTGMKYHVDLHLEVDPEMTVRESHAVAAQVKISVKERLNWVADVLVHVEPAPAHLLVTTEFGAHGE